MTNPIEITNVGTVESLSISPEPGVTVLVGENGSGKSTALAICDQLLTGRKAGYQKRDGTASGWAEGWGVRITLGRTTRRSGADSLEVTALEGLDPSLLVDPGYKGKAEADTARMHVLLGLGGVTADIAEFQHIAPEGLDLRALLGSDLTSGDDPVALADAVRRGLHAEARRVEKQRDTVQVALDGLRAQIGDDTPGDDEVTDEAVLRTLYDDASRAVTEATTLRKIGLQRDEQADVARESLAGIERPQIQRMEDDFAEAEHALAVARKALTEAEKGFITTQLALTSGREQSSIIAAAEDAVSMASEVYPEQIEVDTLTEQAAAAHRSVERGAVLRAAQAKIARLDEAKAQHGALAKHVDQLRESARSTDEVLSGMLQRGILEPYKFAFLDGTLVMPTERSDATAFSELSQGEAYKVALNIATQYVQEEDRAAAFVIRQEAWEGLDPSNRDLVNSLCIERDVMILTARADEGPLRAEKHNEGEL